MCPQKLNRQFFVILSANIYRFEKSSTCTLTNKLRPTIKRSLKIPANLNRVDTLPCEILVFKNRTDRRHSGAEKSAHELKRMWLLKMIVSWHRPAKKVSHKFIVVEYARCVVQIIHHDLGLKFLMIIAVLNKKLSYRLETGRQQCISL